MFTKILLMVSFILLVACSVSEKKLSSDGSKVEVLSQKQNADCQVLEKVIGKNNQGSDDLALNHAKNLAADLDGNAIFVDDMVSNGKSIEAHATVYNCKK